MAAHRTAPRTAARKRPAQARSSVMVAAILQAAAELLDHDAPERYTTNQIAARAGASIGSLYQYFPSKDAITAALIAQASARLVAELEHAADIPDWRAALRAMVGSAVRHQLGRPALARRLDAEEARLAAAVVQREDQLRIRAVLGTVMARIPDLQDPGAVGEDLIAITRALCDAAGERREVAPDALSLRVERALFGYLKRD